MHNPTWLWDTISVWPTYYCLCLAIAVDFIVICHNVPIDSSCYHNVPNESPFIISTEHSTARLLLSMAGKLCISSAFATMYPLTVEIFPTVLRNVGLGVTSTGGKIGGFVSPYINLLVWELTILVKQSASITSLNPLSVCRWTLPFLNLRTHLYVRVYQLFRSFIPNWGG